MFVLAIRLQSSVTAGYRLNGSDLAPQPQQIRTSLLVIGSNSPSYLQLSRTYMGRAACQLKNLLLWLFPPTSSRASTLAPGSARNIPRFLIPKTPRKALSIQPLQIAAYCYYSLQRCTCLSFSLEPWLCFKAYVPQN